ncbi:MAG: D-2-hydroxyacid dehydrogenase [Chloroflexi bacterium]|nr:D-2-hydroxyacid dehydrogenase [Chloroflexota bacterium]
MSKVNVLVISKQAMPEDFLQEIEAVDPKIKARDATMLHVEEWRRKGVSSAWVSRLEQEAQRDLARGVPPPKEGETLDSALQEAEVIFVSNLCPPDLAVRSPRLKWVHLGGTGLDRYLGLDIFDGRVTVTNSKGVPAIAIAEQIIGYMFMLTKNAFRLYECKRDRRWERFPNVELADKTACVVGMGAIGTQVAKLAKGLGMRVVATRRSATERQYNVGPVDEVYPRSQLLEMLAQSDFVILSVPLTEETRKLIGERELRAMKPTAYIMNTGRGPVIDEAALIRALREGRIAGAGLDVFEQEPLPPEAEIWQAPNVVLSSHMAGLSDGRGRRVSRLFCENLKRYVLGQPLLNVVTRDKGY